MKFGPRAFLALLLCGLFALLPRVSGDPEAGAAVSATVLEPVSAALQLPLEERSQSGPFVFEELLSAVGVSVDATTSTSATPTEEPTALEPPPTTLPPATTVPPTTVPPTTVPPTTTVPPATTVPPTTVPPTTVPPTTVPPATTTIAPTTTSAPTTTISRSLTNQEKAQRMLELVEFDWRSAFPDWVIEFEGERAGIRGLTYPGEKRIVIYIRSDDTPETIHRVFAHELGHAIDVEFNSNDERDEWRRQRGIAGNVPWWPSAAAPDFATGAGDFAEAFAVLETGISTRSTVAAQPTESDLELLIRLMRG